MSAERVAAVLTYNSSTVIGRCLDALAASEGDWRIMVADNASADDTVAICKDYPGVEVTRYDENYGYAGGYNRVLKALGENGARQVAIINPDAFVAPDCLNLLSDALDQDPRAIIASPRILSPSLDGQLLVDSAGGEMVWQELRPRYYGRGETDSDLIHKRRKVELASGSCLLMNLSKFEEVGCFDEDFFLYFEETDLCLRAGKLGFNIWYVPEAEVVHVKRRSSGTMTDPETTEYYTRNALLSAVKHMGREFVIKHLVSFLVAQIVYQMQRKGTDIPAELAAVQKGVDAFLHGRFGKFVK